MSALGENDADRALALAIRSTRLLGFVSAAFGLVMIVVFGYFNRFPQFRTYFIAFGMIVWFVPGVIFLASAFYLKQRRRAGAIWAMVVALWQSVCAAAILIACCTLPPVTPIPIGMCLFWLAALGQMVVHLQRSMRVINADTTTRPGFEMPRAVLPVDASDSSSATP